MAKILLKTSENELRNVSVVGLRAQSLNIYYINLDILKPTSSRKL